MFDKKRYKSLKERFENTILFFQYANAIVAYEDDVKVVSEISGIKFDMLNDGTFFVKIPKEQANDVLQKVSEAGYRIGICEPIQF